MFNKFGLHQGLLSFIPKLNTNSKIKKRNSIIKFSFVFSFLLSIIFIIIIIFNLNFFSKTILNNKNINQLIVFMTPLIIVLTFNSIFEGVFRGLDKINIFIYSQRLLVPLSKLILVIVFLIIGFKLYSIVVGVYLSFFIGLLYMYNKAKKYNIIGSLNYEYKSTYSDLCKFSFPLMMAGFLGFLIKRTDTFMIGFFLSEFDVGVYNIAYKLGLMSQFFLVAFIKVFAPIISTLYYEGKKEKLKKLYVSITKWIFASNLIILFLVLIFSKEIMEIFGREYIYGSLALIFIILGQTANGVVGPADKINVMTGYPQYSLYTNIIAIIFNIILNYNLIPIYGIEGAAFASFISILISNLIRLFLLYKTHNIHPYNSEYLKVILSAFLPYVFINVINNLIYFHWLGNLIIFSIGYLILFLIIYYHLGMSEEDELVWEKIINKKDELFK